MAPSLDGAPWRIDLDGATNQSQLAHRTLSPGLTGALRGFLYAAAAASLAAGLALANEARRFDAVAEGRLGALGRLADAEEVSEGVVGVFSLCGIVVAILTIIWWYQAYQAIERAGVAQRRWSSGWAVGGWFIPLANLVIPKKVLDEIDRVSAAATDGAGEWRQRRVLRVSNWWWGCFVAGSVLLGIGSGVAADQVERGLPDPDLYSSALSTSSAGFMVSVAAALFGAATLRIIGERLNR
jgi:hypothetical protein